MKETHTVKSEEKKKQKKKMTTAGKIKLLIVLGVLAYVIVMVVNQQLMMQQLEAEKAALSEQKQQLETDKNYYENELEYINSDEYVEQEAKDRLGWIKDGETKYVISED